jgi:ABC-2 type transport system permease protein
MRNVILVLKHEIIKTIGKPSFWITAFVFPLVIFTFTFGSQLLTQGLLNDGANDDVVQNELNGEAPGFVAATPSQVGYVDEAGIVDALPPDIPSGLFLAFSSVGEADEALAARQIDQYYLVRADFRETSDVILVQERFSPFEVFGSSDLFQYVLTYNLVGDPDVAALVQQPMPRVSMQSIAPAVEPSAGPPELPPGQFSLAPMAMLFIFFFVLTMSSGFVLRSVTKEKENRIVEVLLLSLRPRDLMLGKIVGLGAVGLLQMALWLGGLLLVMGEASPVVGMAGQILSATLPPYFLLWAGLYFLFGYVTFASLLGALGTLAPNMREGSQFTFLVLLPLMIPLWLNMTFVEAPNGIVPTVLSLFPLTAPVSMVARLAATTVPLWQILVSLGLLAVTTYGFVLLSASFFRGDTLLSNASLNMKRLRSELFGKS